MFLRIAVPNGLENGFFALGRVLVTGIVALFGTSQIAISSMLLFRLGSGVLFGIILDLGVIGVWIAMGTDWLARSVLFTLRYKNGKWKTIKIINETNE